MKDDRLARRMAVDGEISVSEASGLIEDITRILRDAVVSGDEVRLNGFGVMRMKRVSKVAWDPVQRKKVRRKKKQVLRWKPTGELTNLQARKPGGKNGADCD